MYAQSVDMNEVPVLGIWSHRIRLGVSGKLAFLGSSFVRQVHVWSPPLLSIVLGTSPPNLFSFAVFCLFGDVVIVSERLVFSLELDSELPSVLDIWARCCLVLEPPFAWTSDVLSDGDHSSSMVRAGILKSALESLDEELHDLTNLWYIKNDDRVANATSAKNATEFDNLLGIFRCRQWADTPQLAGSMDQLQCNRARYLGSIYIHRFTCICFGFGFGFGGCGWWLVALVEVGGCKFMSNCGNSSYLREYSKRSNKKWQIQSNPN